MAAAIDILIAMPRIKPMTEKNPARVPCPSPPRAEYSPMSPPAKQPSKAPITVPIRGRGTERKNMPRKPPISAPQPARGLAPDFRAVTAEAANSQTSPNTTATLMMIRSLAPKIRQSVHQP